MPASVDAEILYAFNFKVQEYERYRLDYALDAAAKQRVQTALNRLTKVMNVCACTAQSAHPPRLQAYDVLIDKEAREAYDSMLADRKGVSLVDLRVRGSVLFALSAHMQRGLQREWQEQRTQQMLQTQPTRKRSASLPGPDKCVHCRVVPYSHRLKCCSQLGT